jgi:hypothetical protein
MYDDRNFLPTSRKLINCSEHPAIDGAPADSPCTQGHPEIKGSAAEFAAATRPAGVQEFEPPHRPLKLGQCLKCGSTVTLPPELYDDITQVEPMLWQLRDGGR